MVHLPRAVFGMWKVSCESTLSVARLPSYGCSGIVPYILLDHLWEFLSNAMKASQLGLLEAGKAEMCALGPVRT
jgi:hypothetical protein